MSTVVTARIARADSGAFRYQRNQPEKTLLYQLVLKHYPDFRRRLAEEGRVSPDRRGTRGALDGDVPMPDRGTLFIEFREQYTYSRTTERYGQAHLSSCTRPTEETDAQSFIVVTR